MYYQYLSPSYLAASPFGISFLTKTQRRYGLFIANFHMKIMLPANSLS
jgi:hypothetical protein